MSISAKITAAIAAFKKLSPSQQERILEEQRHSWVRGEIAIGSDKDEAEYRAALSRGDVETLKRLDAEAAERAMKFDANRK